MRTIPIAAASMLLAARPDLREALRSHGVAMGARAEVDLAAVERESPELAHALRTYQGQNKRTWARIAAGNFEDTEHVVTRRTLVERAQVTGKVGRADLGDILEDLLLSDAGLSQVLEELLCAEPDEQLLTRTVRDAEGSITRSDAGTWVVTAPLRGRSAWPESLGGVQQPTEIDRRVTMTARHAAWRDRRTRRLARASIEIDELWANPTAARALLPAPAPGRP